MLPSRRLKTGTENTFSTPEEICFIQTQSCQKFLSKKKKTKKKSNKSQEGFSPPTFRYGWGIYFLFQHLCITSNALKSLYFSFCRWQRQIKKVTSMSQQVTAKRQLEMRTNYSFYSHSKTLLPATVIVLNFKGICRPSLISAYFI